MLAQTIARTRRPGITLPPGDANLLGLHRPFWLARIAGEDGLDGEGCSSTTEFAARQSLGRTEAEVAKKILFTEVKMRLPSTRRTGGGTLSGTFEYVCI